MCVHSMWLTCASPTGYLHPLQRSLPRPCTACTSPAGAVPRPFTATCRSSAAPVPLHKCAMSSAALTGIRFPSTRSTCLTPRPCYPLHCADARGVCRPAAETAYSKLVRRAALLLGRLLGQLRLTAALGDAAWIWLHNLQGRPTCMQLRNWTLGSEPWPWLSRVQCVCMCLGPRQRPVLLPCVLRVLCLSLALKRNALFPHCTQ